MVRGIVGGRIDEGRWLIDRARSYVDTQSNNGRKSAAQAN